MLPPTFRQRGCAGCRDGSRLSFDFSMAFQPIVDVETETVFAYEAGSVAIPQGPGLGIEVDEDYVRERAVEGHRWRNPVWRHADGSFAEW